MPQENRRSRNTSARCLGSKEKFGLPGLPPRHEPNPLRQEQTLYEELDHAAKQLNVSRQAVIKTLIRQALDQHYRATMVKTKTVPQKQVTVSF